MGKHSKPGRLMGLRPHPQDTVPVAHVGWRVQVQQNSNLGGHDKVQRQVAGSRGRPRGAAVEFHKIVDDEAGRKNADGGHPRAQHQPRRLVSDPEIPACMCLAFSTP